jgi:hypothetical protein
VCYRYCEIDKRKNSELNVEKKDLREIFLFLLRSKKIYIFVFRMPIKMVLEHPGLLPNLPAQGLQPALQLYAAAAAQLGPRSRVPPWAPFLQFGMPGVFGGQFLAGPRFGPPGSHSGLAGLTSLNGLGGSSGSHSSLSPPRTMHGPPSEDSNDGEFNGIICSMNNSNLFLCRVL